jgi:hypothetical protein
MYLDAEITDHLDISLLLKTHLKKKTHKQNKAQKLLYARLMCVIGQGVD